MDKLWNQRLQHYLKMLMKYSRYVFNDHFVIALMFFVGGLGFGYTNTLKQIQKKDSIWLLVVLAILLLLLSLGRLSTLLKPADQLFLLPKEKEIQNYLVKARRFSMVLPFFFLIVGAFVVYPLLILLKQWNILELILLMISLLLLKSFLLWIELDTIYVSNQESRRQLFLSWVLIGVILAIGIVFSPIISLVSALICEILARFKIRKDQQNLLNWEWAIKKEEKRMLGIYRMINLFTDVPQISDSIKRRKYLDPVLNRIPRTHHNAYLFLFSRGLLRSKTYFGLFLRLLVLSLLLMFIVNNQILLIVLSALFLYLMAFQLLPFYKQYDQSLWVAIYPTTLQDKQRSFEKIVFLLMSIFALVLILASLFVLGFNKILIIFIVILFIEIALFVGIYLPHYLKKAENL